MHIAVIYANAPRESPKGNQAINYSPGNRVYCYKTALPRVRAQEILPKFIGPLQEIVEVRQLASTGHWSSCHPASVAACGYHPTFT